MGKLIRFAIGVAVLFMFYKVHKPLHEAGVYSSEYWQNVEDQESDYEYDDGEPAEGDGLEEGHFAYDDFDTESDY